MRSESRLRRLSSRQRIVPLALAACALTALGIAWAAEPAPPAPPPVSKYAPAADLAGLAQDYAGSFSEPTSDADKYNEAAQAKVKKDAHTLAVVALALHLSDEDHPLKPASPALVAAARELAAAADVEAARSAAGKIDRLVGGAASDEGSDAPTLADWQKVASMGALMKQVTFVQNRLKRGLQPNRFQQLSGETAKYAALLAVIGQAVTVDTHEVKNPADLPDWYRYCGDMRDAAGEVNAAIHAQDLDAVNAAMVRLEKSCNGCHQVFRKDLIQ